MQRGCGGARAELGILLVPERSEQGGKSKRAEIALLSLKWIFEVGEMLATILVKDHRLQLCLRL